MKEKVKPTKGRERERERILLEVPLQQISINFIIGLQVITNDSN